MNHKERVIIEEAEKLVHESHKDWYRLLYSKFSDSTSLSKKDYKLIQAGVVPFSYNSEYYHELDNDEEFEKDIERELDDDDDDLEGIHSRKFIVISTIRIVDHNFVALLLRLCHFRNLVFKFFSRNGSFNQNNDNPLEDFSNNTHLEILIMDRKSKYPIPYVEKFNDVLYARNEIKETYIERNFKFDIESINWYCGRAYYAVKEERRKEGYKDYDDDYDEPEKEAVLERYYPLNCRSLKEYLLKYNDNELSEFGLKPFSQICAEKEKETHHEDYSLYQYKISGVLDYIVFYGLIKLQRKYETLCGFCKVTFNSVPLEEGYFFSWEDDETAFVSVYIEYRKDSIEMLRSTKDEERLLIEKNKNDSYDEKEAERDTYYALTDGQEGVFNKDLYYSHDED